MCTWDYGGDPIGLWVGGQTVVVFYEIFLA